MLTVGACKHACQVIAAKDAITWKLCFRFDCCSTAAAASLPLTWLRTTAAVRPTPLLPLPVVYTARGATLATCFSS
jgi:hypothetical protein